jgi:hypothetical protein
VAVIYLIFAIIGVIIYQVTKYIVSLRRQNAVLRREENIERLERDLNIRDPKSYGLKEIPTEFVLSLNQRVMEAGDKLTIRCGWRGCNYTVVTTATEATVINEECVPGTDDMLRHQANYGHYKCKIEEKVAYR